MDGTGLCLLPGVSHTHTHLGCIQADDSIYIPGAVEEVGDCDSVFAGGNPVLLGVRVDLEDVGPGAEDGLFTAHGNKEHKQTCCAELEIVQTKEPSQVTDKCPVAPRR